MPQRSTSSGGGAAEWSLAAAQDVIAAAVGDRTMIAAAGVRRSYSEVAGRTRALAAVLADRGLGAHRERAGLRGWESGQDAVALVLRNRPEYLEAMLACFRARAVPFNVNHHYRPREVRGLFDTVAPGAVVYQRSLGPLVAESVGDRRVVLVDVDDSSGAPPLPGSVELESAIAAAPVTELPEPRPDDLYAVCTGGTTGAPKAVLWRQADIFVAAMAGREGATAAELAAAARDGHATFFPVAPLMHAAAQWTAFCGLHTGSTVVLHDDAGPFDARAVLEVAERERVTLMSIVGDAHAGPIAEELRRRDYDLGSLLTLATGGAATNARHTDAILEVLPSVVVVDGYGSSETGGMAYGARTRERTPRGFSPSTGATVVSADRSRFLVPGDDELGWTARRGRVPLGYLGDPDRTATTFPVVAGERVSVPGDRARLAADGSIRMLGRDSLVVNTGGEKVFVEEVEEVLRGHPDVVDAVVVGRPSERFGQEVVALVELAPGADVTPGGLREHVSGSLARFKAPRAVLVCDHVPRLANGKADYGHVTRLAARAVDVTAPGG